MTAIAIFETPAGQIDVRVERESIWLTQRQMAHLFQTTPDNISLHLKNIYADEELGEQATTEDFSVVQKEGARNVERVLKHYNLDAIIATGYRVNSRRATQFRQWATRILKDYLTRGYVLDQERLKQNAQELDAVLRLARRVLAHPEFPLEAGRGLAEIVTRYTQTFLWLQSYDEGRLTEPHGRAEGLLFTPEEARAGIACLKAALLAKNEASALFGSEREHGLSAILGNLGQSVFGEAAYPTLESRAAHLLYFIVKDHPFSDGNKRIGAFLFAGFLHRNGRLFDAEDHPCINDICLAALSLLVAQSRPEEKDTLILLIMNMIAGESEST
jgi:prophage maintenance system killer protein